MDHKYRTPVHPVPSTVAAMHHERNRRDRIRQRIDELSELADGLPDSDERADIIKKIEQLNIEFQAED